MCSHDRLYIVCNEGLSMRRSYIQGYNNEDEEEEDPIFTFLLARFGVIRDVMRKL